MAKKSALIPVFFATAALCFQAAVPGCSAADLINWGDAVLINNIPNFTDAGLDPRGIRPGKYGSEYPRMAKLADGSWLCVYTIYDNNGYHDADLHGLSWKGNALQIARSTDKGRTWKVIATQRDNNRDLDNGMIVQLPDGRLRMAARSVRWQESYRIYVWGSSDGGATWQWLSSVDANEGKPGGLGNPDKGLYEPHFVLLEGGRLAVMYANEKHVSDGQSYSQIISEKVSSDGGASWGKEIWVGWDPGSRNLRPGMPVWTRMSDGRYIVAYEVVAPGSVNIYCKTSNDGISWASGLGKQVPGHYGAPFVLALSDGRLLLTSNSHRISVSSDLGKNWALQDKAPWGPMDPQNNFWPSLYQIDNGEVGALTSVSRTPPQNPVKSEGHNVQIRFGSFVPLPERPGEAAGTGEATAGGYKDVQLAADELLSIPSDRLSIGIVPVFQ